jgi:hypothetical protein
MRGPAHPKNSAEGKRLRISSTRREAYKSPEASPAEIRILGPGIGTELFYIVVSQPFIKCYMRTVTYRAWASSR